MYGVRNLSVCLQPVLKKPLQHSAFLQEGFLVMDLFLWKILALGFLGTWNTPRKYSGENLSCTYCWLWVNKPIVLQTSQQLLQPYTHSFKTFHREDICFVLLFFWFLCLLVPSLCWKCGVWYVSIPLLPGNVKAICCSNWSLLGVFHYWHNLEVSIIKWSIILNLTVKRHGVKLLAANVKITFSGGSVVFFFYFP